MSRFSTAPLMSSHDNTEACEVCEGESHMPGTEVVNGKLVCTRCYHLLQQGPLELSPDVSPAGEQAAAMDEDERLDAVVGR
jgi:hypothetical protein